MNSSTAHAQTRSNPTSYPPAVSASRRAPWWFHAGVALALNLGACDTDRGSIDVNHDSGTMEPDAIVANVCGDGILRDDEVCDDGNTLSGDGCTAQCDAIERYYQCGVPGAACSRVPFDEVLEAGLDRYVGTFEPPSSEVEGDLTTYTWSGEERPYCLDGEFTMSTRAGSNDLLIVLGGGGICVPDLPIHDRGYGVGLIARTAFPDGQCNRTASPGVRSTGVLDDSNPENPFAGWSSAYVPNCDGSVFSGDTDERPGLRYLTAALDAIKAQFPNATRVALLGTSAGGYGVPIAMALVRSLYPEAELLVLADGGLLVGRPEEPAFISGVIDYLGVGHIVDAACDVVADSTACEDADHPHLTWLYDYALREDSNMTVGLITSYEDLTIGAFFLALYHFNPLPWEERFHVRRYGEAVNDAIAPIATAHPGRIESYQYEGTQHVITVSEMSDGGLQDALALVLGVLGLGDLATQFGSGIEDIYTMESSGVRLVEWLQAMVDGTSDFESVFTE